LLTKTKEKEESQALSFSFAVYRSFRWLRPQSLQTTDLQLLIAPCSLFTVHCSLFRRSFRGLPPASPQTTILLCSFFSVHYSFANVYDQSQKKHAGQDACDQGGDERGVGKGWVHLSLPSSLFQWLYTKPLFQSVTS
jgi:hypothetical protein